MGALEWLEPRTLLSGGSVAGFDSGHSRIASPVAVDDYYSTPAGVMLVVSAPGVLANDYDPDGDRFEAWHLNGLGEPVHGWLYMEASNGSFTYQPDAGYNGPDTFTYWACDFVNNEYGEATVTIDVGVFNHTPHVASPIDNVTVDQGAPDTVIDLAGVFDDVDIPGGDQLTYSVTVSPPILPIVDQISQSSYEDIHGNMLYTHLGDSRGYDTPQHDLARDNIYNYFQDLGLTTSVDTISEVEDIVGGIYHFDPPLVNVIGEKLGVTHPEEVYIVGAHYDSVHNPGADDNASGVAGVMELARVLSAYSFDSTLRFIAFDGEEDGLWGSMYYAEAHADEQIRGMISLDMIAYNQPGDPDVVSLFDGDSAGAIKSHLISAFADYGGGVTARDAGSLDASDHAPFEWFGFDAALVIESAMESEPYANEHYHESTDAVETPDYLDYAYATNVTGAVAGYLATFARPVATVDFLTADVAGSLLTVHYDAGKYGGAVVNVRATDTGGLIAEDSFSVTVNVGVSNHPPHVANPIADVTVDQGAPDTVIDLSDVFADVDSDPLTYSVTVLPPILSIVNQVSQSSYEDLLGNGLDPDSGLLYTHLGDSRRYDTPQHDLARDNIYNHFQSLGLTTSLDIIAEAWDDWGNKIPFDPPLVNVVGVKPGVTHPDNVYLVGAHYDSVHSPGADDNASGVAGVMEIARVLSACSFDATLAFVAFDGEEDGLWGSMHYAEYHGSDQNIPGFASQILGMISLDMIAYNQTGEGRDVVSLFDADGAGAIKSHLVSAFADYGGGVTAVDAGILDLSDHAPFEWFGLDAALVIEKAMESYPFANEHYHRPSDAVETPDYIDYAYATKITRAVAGYLAQSAQPVATVDFLTANVAGSLLTLHYDAGKYGGAVVNVRATDTGGLIADDSFEVTVDPRQFSQVAGRHLFYNNSNFDGNDPAANAADDSAIAPDKAALLPGGGMASFENYTSFSRGINGIMIDVAGLPAATLDAADFAFRRGNDEIPSGWAKAADPTSITVRPGAGSGGSDRITLVWPDKAIPNGNWLQVTVLANADTGLAATDVFYFGCAIGEVGNSGGDAKVNSSDVTLIRGNYSGFSTVAIDNVYDFSRDGKVNSADVTLCRNHFSGFSPLQLIGPPAALLSPSSGPAPLTTGVEAPPGISVQARRTLDGAVFGPDGLRWDAQTYLDLVWAWQLERVKPGQKSSDGDLRMQGALDRQFADYERPDVTRCYIGP